MEENISNDKEDESDRLMRLFCGALIIANVCWVIVHMFFHYQGVLNPWKLGGYAMYTKPSPFFYAIVDVVGGKDEDRLNGKPVYYLNLFSTGGCLSGISKRFYKKITFINPEMIQEDGFTRMTFYEQNLSMLDRKFSRHIVGQATLTLDKKGVMTVKEEFCDKKREFSINVQK